MVRSRPLRQHLHSVELRTAAPSARGFDEQNLTVDHVRRLWHPWLESRESLAATVWQMSHADADD
jgi:hypothetical protein